MKCSFYKHNYKIRYVIIVAIIVGSNVNIEEGCNDCVTLIGPTSVDRTSIECMNCLISSAKRLSFGFQYSFADAD